MYFVLDKKSYKLLLKIKKENGYKSDKSSEFFYLKEFQFIDFYSYDLELFHITPKGEVALNNYRENKYLLLFNKIISILTLFVALGTLVITLYQIFKPC